MSPTALLGALVLANVAITAGGAGWESLAGDPGMRETHPRLMLEAWSFCNRACAPADSSCAVSPRYADCASEDGPGPFGNRITLSDEALGAAPYESSDEAAVRKEQLLASRCAVPFRRASLGESHFWTAMLKSGNAIDVAECGIGGGECTAYYASGTAPRLPVAEATQVAAEAAAARRVRDGRRASRGEERALPARRLATEPAEDAQACAAVPRPWYANRLPVNQPLVSHRWAEPRAHGDARGWSGSFVATYGNGSEAVVRWRAPGAPGGARREGGASAADHAGGGVGSVDGGGVGGGDGSVFSCELRTSARYPWLMLYIGGDAARGRKGGAAYDGRGMLATPAPGVLDAYAQRRQVSSGGLLLYVPALLSFGLRLLELSPHAGCFYALNLAGCWRMDGAGCTGDTRADVTRYALLDVSGPSLCSAGAQANCPAAHRFANGSVALRSEEGRFPYAAYKYYCGPAEPSGGCDLFSNPQLQEIIKLAPHAEWADVGLPARAPPVDGRWARYAVDVGRLSARLVFAGTPPSVGTRWWATANVGAEAGIPGVSGAAGGAVARWEVAGMDLRVPSALFARAGGEAEGGEGAEGEAGTLPLGAAASGGGALDAADEAQDEAGAAAEAEEAAAAAAVGAARRSGGAAAAAAGARAYELAVGPKAVSRTDDVFVCVTLDWWPANKCDYGHCQWANASVLSAPLSDNRLVAALAYLAPVTLRVGGTLQDNVTYALHGERSCPPFSPPPPQPSATFAGGCLRAEQLEPLLALCVQARARLLLSLNSVVGRANGTRGAQPRGGGWDGSQALALLRLVAARGAPSDPLWGVEYGNEPGHVPPSSFVFCEATQDGSAAGSEACAWQSVRQAAEAEADGLRELDGLVTAVYGPRGGRAGQRRERPRVVGPAWTTFAPQPALAYLRRAGGALDVLTYHAYPLGPAYGAPGLLERMLGYRPAGAEAAMGAAVGSAGAAAREAGRRVRASVWVGEAGGAYNSGHAQLSGSLANSFWFAPFLGANARAGAGGVCRQSLLGGGYALLQTGSLRPRADFFVAALFGRLMGAAVLHAELRAPDAAGARDPPAAAPVPSAFAHCARLGRQAEAAAAGGGGAGAEAAQQRGGESPWAGAHAAFSPCDYLPELCARGGTALLLVNPTSDHLEVSIPAQQLSPAGGASALGAALPRLEFRLTASELASPDSELQLNGQPLRTGPAGELPALEPRVVREGPARLLPLGPQSVNFFVLTAAQASACAAMPAAPL